MRRIKTYLRTFTTTTRLHKLALMSIEREFSSKLLEGPTKITDEFAKLKIEDFNLPNKYYK